MQFAQHTFGKVDCLLERSKYVCRQRVDELIVHVAFDDAVTTFVRNVSFIHLSRCTCKVFFSERFAFACLTVHVVYSNSIARCVYDVSGWNCYFGERTIGSAFVSTHPAVQHIVANSLCQCGYMVVKHRVGFVVADRVRFVPRHVSWVGRKDIERIGNMRVATLFGCCWE